MLSEPSADVVRQTAAAVAANAEQITARFYPRMFAAHPELLRVFNQGNQANGTQSRALAASVVAYAVHLVDPSAPDFRPVLERIAHKHVSLGIRPDQYPIVGRHLMAAVGEVLGDAVTPPVAAAWDEVYWLFATQLVAEEARLYQQAGVDPAAPWRPWRVTERIVETPDVISLVLRPADGEPAPEVVAGQYVSVAVDLPDGSRQPRQYTVSSAARPDAVQISVRRVRGVDGAPDGRVSGHLHDAVAVGDVLEVGPPVGDVVVDAGADPLLLVSAGIGVTPMAAIVEHVARAQPQRAVTVAHADRSPAYHALRAAVSAAGDKIENFDAVAWYERGAAATGEPTGGWQEREGLLDLSDVALPEAVRVLLCGPLPFMRDARAGLLGRGVAPERVRYEVFGPDLWAGSPAA